MGTKDSERERLVKAHAWLRLFTDGRTLNGCNEEGVWFDRLPQKRADGSMFITTTIQPWANVEADLRARGVPEPDLTRGEMAAKRALGLAVALLLLIGTGCQRAKWPPEPGQGRDVPPVSVNDSVPAGLYTGTSWSLTVQGGPYYEGEWSDSFTGESIEVSISHSDDGEIPWPATVEIEWGDGTKSVLEEVQP